MVHFRVVGLTYGPYLKGRYGIGFVVWTSQFSYGAAGGLLKLDGVHSMRDRAHMSVCYWNVNAFEL